MSHPYELIENWEKTIVSVLRAVYVYENKCDCDDHNNKVSFSWYCILSSMLSSFARLCRAVSESRLTFFEENVHRSNDCVFVPLGWIFHIYFYPRCDVHRWIARLFEMLQALFAVAQLDAVVENLWKKVCRVFTHSHITWKTKQFQVFERFTWQISTKNQEKEKKSHQDMNAKFSNIFHRRWL